MTTKKGLTPRAGVTALDRAVELTTPQSLVHIKHTISLQQYKYFLLFFDEMSIFLESGIEPDEKGFYSIRMEKISERIGYEPNKKEIWNDLVKLKNETIAVNYLMKDGQPIKYGAGYISEWAISNSFIKFKFPSFFVEVAKKFKEHRRLFLELNWEIFNSFTGKYEAILYKLCKDYEKSGGKRTPEFSIDGFKEYMGIKDGEYQEFKRLAMRVINEPIKKINESQLSDIKISAQYNTKGRKVVGLYFEIESRNQQSLPIGNDNADDPFMIARVPIPMTLQTEYLKTHTLEDAKLCIQAANEWIDGKIKAGETVVHGRAYRKALEENWKPNKKDIEAQVKVIEAKQVHVTKNEAAKEKAETQEVEEKRKRLESLENEFNSLPESEKNNIRLDFEKQLNSTLARTWSKAKAKNPTTPEEWISVKVDFFRFYGNFNK